MKYISNRHLFETLRTYSLLPFIGLLFVTNTAFAVEDAVTVPMDAPYKSPFEDYRASSIDTLSEWRTINQSSGAGAGHGHHEGAEVTATPKAGPDAHTETNNDKKGESHEH